MAVETLTDIEPDRVSLFSNYGQELRAEKSLRQLIGQESNLQS